MRTRTPWALGVGLVLAAASVAEAQRVTPVPVFVNGGRLDNNAFLLKNMGRSVLPMRTLFESLGARVEWDGTQRAVYAWKEDGSGIRLGLGEPTAQRMQMSGAPSPGNWGRVVGTQRLDAPAMLIDGRVFVPLRFASEALNADVRYASSEPAVYIRTESVAGARQDFEPTIPPRDPRPPRRPEPEEPEEVEAPAPNRPQRIAAALNAQLVVSDEMPDGSRPVRFDFIVSNRSNRPLAIPFRSGQQFDIQVLQEGRLVWNWARNRSFTQALTSTTLEPGEELRFTGRWNFRDNRGRQVQPGRYLVRGILTTSFQRPQIIAEERIDVER